MKKKFNVSGVALAHILVNGIEANNKEEAIEKLKEMFEGNKFVDWADWQNVDATEAVNCVETVNKVISNMGLSDCYKVKDVPEIVFDFGDFLLLSVRFSNLCNGKAIATSGKVYFIMLENGEVFLPIKQENSEIENISFNYMKGNTQIKNNLTKVFFTNGSEVLAFMPSSEGSGTFAMIKDSTTNTILGNRIKYIIEKTGLSELYIRTSDAYSLELTTSNGKVDLNAEYDSPLSNVPIRLTKIESII